MKGVRQACRAISTSIGTATEPVAASPPPGPALTVKQAAALLGVSPSLVYLLCARGKIRHERHGLRRGVIRIAAGAIDDYRKKATVAGAVTAPPPPPVRVRLTHIRL